MPKVYPNTTSLSDKEVEQIISITDEERLTSYFKDTENRREALELYALNGDISKHVLELLGGFEVALRNSVSASITHHYGRADWYRTRRFVSILKPERRRSIRTVRGRLKSQGQDERPGRIVAGLTLHFWVAIHENKYRDTIWTPHLHRIWPRKENLRFVHKDLLKIQELRNRIAHFKPVYKQKWLDRIDLVWTRFGQITPPKSAWYQQRLGKRIKALRRQCDFC